MRIDNSDITLGSRLEVSTDGKFTVSGTGIFDELVKRVTNLVMGGDNPNLTTPNDES